MMGRRHFVIHLHQEMHSKAKAHCQAHQIKMAAWIHTLIARELRIVERKERMKHAPRAYDEPWMREPFWQKREGGDK